MTTTATATKKRPPGRAVSKPASKPAKTAVRPGKAAISKGAAPKGVAAKATRPKVSAVRAVRSKLHLPKGAATVDERLHSKGTQDAKPKRDKERQIHIVVHHRRRMSARATAIMWTLLFFAVLFMAVSVQALRAQSDRNVDTINQQIRAEAEQYLELRAKLAEKEAPGRIMDRARSLGMIDPGPVAPLASPGGVAEDDSPGPA